MALLAAIDARYHLLPDVLTIPLLLFGFAAAVFGEHIGVITSINGALFGYFVPMLAGVLMHKRHPRGIGGGDYKMLAALGAWLGVDGINLTIAFSFVIFALVSLVKRQRMGPYGPALTIGASLVLLMQIYYNYLPSSWLGLLKVF